jgi:hypothetical protein
VHHRLSPSPGPGSPRSRRGRTLLVALCVVVLALLLLSTLTRMVRTEVRSEAPARKSPRAVGQPRAASARAPIRITASRSAPRGAPRTSIVGAPHAAKGVAPVVRIANDSTSSVATGEPTRVERADTVPTAVLRAADSSPLEFVVLTAGDEELAPVSVITTEAGPMLPLSEFATLIGAVFTDEVGTFSLDLRADEPVTTTMRTESRTGTRIHRGQQHQLSLAERDLTSRDGRWYASLDALRSLSGLELAFDTRSQSVVITSPHSALPRYAAAVRRAQRLHSLTDAGDLLAPLRPDSDAHVASSAWLPGSASLTYVLAQDNRTNQWTASGTLGTALLGGGLSVSGMVSNSAQASRAPDITWLGGNPLSKWLTQARIGFGAATGLAAWTGDGISLTNAPFARAMALGTLPLSGVATPGAEIEIQSGGRLLGVVTADADGAWSSPVPVGFGQNVLDVAAYGPLGVTRRSILRSLEGDHLPAGRFEYGVTAQRGRRDPTTCVYLGCGDLGNIDLRWGISTRVTARAGVSALVRDDTAQRTWSSRLSAAPYATLVAAPVGWLQVRQELAGASWSRTRAIVQPSLAWRADIGHERLAGDADAQPFWLTTRAATVRSESWLSSTWRPVPGDLGRLWVSALGRMSDGARGDTRSASLIIGGRVSGSLLTAGADHVSITQPDFSATFQRLRYNAAVTIPQLRVGPRWLATSFATLGASVAPRESRTPRWNAGLTTTLFRTLMLQVASDWQPGSAPGVRLQLQNHGRNAIVIQGVSTAALGSRDLSASTSVLGSVLLPLNGDAPQLTSDLVALRARVRVIAFLDADGNGLRDASESPVPELVVLVGTRQAATDTTGTAIVDGLPVLDAVRVQPDVLFVNDADGTVWTFAGPSPWARLVPYGETLVQLPFVVRKPEPAK